MDYEKKYKEALERARELQHDNCWVTNIFPELKESEDEKIRKRIYNYINVTLDDNENEEKEKWLTWLEKQGESSDKIHYWTEEEIEPIISDYLRGAEHYGGMIARLRCLKPKSLEKQSEHIDYNEELKKCRENPLYFFDKYVQVKLKEQKYAWSENDEEMCIDAVKYLELFDAQGIHGDVAIPCIEWLKSLKQRLKGE